MISGSTHYIEIDGEKYKLCLDEDDNYYIIKDDKKTIIEYDDNILEYLPMIANDLSFCPHFADALNEHFKENIDKYPLDVLFPKSSLLYSIVTLHNF